MMDRLRNSSLALKTLLLFALCVALALACSALAGALQPETTPGLKPLLLRAAFLTVFLLAAAWGAAAIFGKGRGKALPDSFARENHTQLSNAGRLTSMGELTSSIAHELNQPLCVIRGYVELLRNVLKDNPVLKEKQLDSSFEICVKSVEKASKIINHMRNFAKKKTLREETARPDAVVEEALSFFIEQFRSHNIDIVKEFEESLPSVAMDKQAFENIIVSLASNSRFFLDQMSPPDRTFKKHLVIRLYKDKDAKNLVLEMEDNGVGMTSETLNSCASPFFTTKEDEGTGLGLCALNEIIKDHGGDWKITSQPNRGCKVRITLPAKAA